MWPRRQSVLLGQSPMIDGGATAQNAVWPRDRPPKEPSGFQLVARRLCICRTTSISQPVVCDCSSHFPFSAVFCSACATASWSLAKTSPRFCHSSFAMRPFSIRHSKYPLAKTRHSGLFFPGGFWDFKQRK